MKKNSDLSVAEIVRVKEVPTSQTDLPQGCGPRRLFKATNADGSICTVGSGGLFMQDTVYCFRCESHNDCEGATRVMCVLTDEKLKQQVNTVLGYSLRGDGKKSGPIGTIDSPAPSATAKHLTNYGLAIVRDDVA